jgi:hypothetical protein
MSNHPDSPEYVTVYTAYGQLAGEMVRILLESMEIPAKMQQESAGAVLGLTVGPLGEAKILVPLEYEAAAREVIQAMEDGKLEEPYYYTDYTNSQHHLQNKQNINDTFTKKD